MDDMATEQGPRFNSSTEDASMQNLFDAGVASQYAGAIAQQETRLESKLTEARVGEHHRKVGRFTRLAAAAAIWAGNLLSAAPAIAQGDEQIPHAQPQQTQELPESVQYFTLSLPITLQAGNIKDGVGNPTVEPPTPTVEHPTLTPPPTEKPPQRELILGGNTQLIKDLEPFTAWVRATQVADNSSVPINGSYHNGETFHNISVGDSLWWTFDSQNTIPPAEQAEYDGSISPEARTLANPDRPLRLQRNAPNSDYYNNFGADVNQPLAENQAITYYIKGTSKRLSPDAVSTVAIGSFDTLIYLDHKQNGDLFVRIGNGRDQRSDLNELVGNIPGEDLDLALQIQENHRDIVVLKPDGRGGYTPFQNGSNNDGVIRLPRTLTEQYLILVLEGQGLMDLEIPDAYVLPGPLANTVEPENLFRENQQNNGIFDRTGQKVGVSGVDASGPLFVRFLTNGGAQYVDFVTGSVFSPNLDPQWASYYSYDYPRQLFDVLKDGKIQGDVPIYLASNDITTTSQNQLLRHFDNMLEFASDQAVILSPFDVNGANQLDNRYFQRFGCSSKKDCLVAITKYINNKNEDPRWDALQEAEPRQKRPANIAAPTNLKPGAFGTFFMNVDAIRAAGGYIEVIDVDPSGWSSVEYRNFASQVAERELQLRPRNVSTSRNGSINDYTSISVSNSADTISYTVSGAQTNSAIFYKDPQTNMTRYNDHKPSEVEVDDQSPYEGIVHTIEESKIK